MLQADILEAGAFTFHLLVPSALNNIWHIVGLNKHLLFNYISEWISIKGEDKALKKNLIKILLYNNYKWGVGKARFQKQEQENIREKGETQERAISEKLKENTIMYRRQSKIDPVYVLVANYKEESWHQNAN